MLKTTGEYCEHEKKRKDCELCTDKFRLGLLTDTDMLLMVEKGIQGGITKAIKRYASVNNKYMKDLYNPDEKSIYLQYLDANNLYGWVMVQNLPTHEFYGRRQRASPLKKQINLSKKARGNIFWRSTYSIQKGCTKITTSCHFQRTE